MKDLAPDTRKTHHNSIALGDFHLPLLFFSSCTPEQTPVCSCSVLMGAQEIPSLAAFAVFRQRVAHRQSRIPPAVSGVWQQPPGPQGRAVISCIRAYKCLLPQMKPELWLRCPHVHWCGIWGRSILQVILVQDPTLFTETSNKVNTLWGQIINK